MTRQNSWRDAFVDTFPLTTVRLLCAGGGIGVCACVCERSDGGERRERETSRRGRAGGMNE
jgi:hypothetical protein